MATYSKFISSRKNYTTVQYADGSIAEIGGSRGLRNNNPGNLTNANAVKYYSKFGAIGADYGGNLVFSTMQGGFNAQKDLVFGKFGDRTIRGMLHGDGTPDAESYAPIGADNDTYNTNKDYADYLTDQGWDVDGIKVNDMTPEQQNRLLADMIRNENITSDANKILEQIDINDTSDTGVPYDGNWDKDAQGTINNPEIAGEDGVNPSTPGMQSGGDTRNDNFLRTGDIGFKDPDRNYPSTNYYDNATTNRAARGEWEPKLKLGGGPEGVPFDVPTPDPRYPYNKVTETSSGHRIELDDTPGNERISIVHDVGSGMEYYADGTVVINSTDKTIQVVGDDFTVYVKGNGDITYEGNVKMHVKGDMHLKVDHNFVVDVGGKYINTAKQGRHITSERDTINTIVGNYSETVTENYTHTTLGEATFISKENFNMWAEGEMEISSKGKAFFTSEEETTVATPTLNMTAESMSIAASTGNIGGSNVWFHGTLNGSINGYARGLWYSPPSPIYRPDANTIQDTLYLSDKGIRDISVDIENKIKESIDMREADTIGPNLPTKSTPSMYNFVKPGPQE